MLPAPLAGGRRCSLLAAALYQLRMGVSSGGGMIRSCIGTYRICRLVKLKHIATLMSSEKKKKKKGGGGGGGAIINCLRMGAAQGREPDDHDPRSQGHAGEDANDAGAPPGIDRGRAQHQTGAFVTLPRSRRQHLQRQILRRGGVGTPPQRRRVAGLDRRRRLHDAPDDRERARKPRGRRRGRPSSCRGTPGTASEPRTGSASSPRRRGRPSI